jgi:hypothetical protein
MEKSGCAAIIAIGLAAVFVLSLATGQCSGPQTRAGNQATTGLAQIGTLAVDPRMVDRMANNRLATFFENGDGVNPEQEFDAIAAALGDSIDRGLRRRLYERYKIELSDEQIVTLATRLIDEQLAQTQAMLAAQGQIKPGATPEQIDEAFRKQFGAPKSQLRDRALNRIRDDLKNADARQDQVENFAREALLERFGQEVQLSDAQIKKNLDEFVFKAINLGLVTDPKAPPAQEQAEKVRAEIEGGLSFEAAIDKYSKDQAPAGKKLSEVTQNIPRRFLEATPEFKTLAELQPGQVSDPIPTSRGFVIFKLIRVEPKAPADFEKRKQDLRREQTQFLAQRRFNDELEALRKDPKSIKWNSKGAQLVYEFFRWRSDPGTQSAGPAGRYQRLREFIEAAEAAANEDATFTRGAVMMAYVAYEQMWRDAKPEDRPSFEDQRLENMTRLFEVTESVDARLKLVDILIQRKDPSAADQLLSAAQANSSLTATGQKRWNEINQRLATLKARQIGTPDVFDQIEQEQQQWVTEKQAEERSQAEQRAEEEKERKRAEAEERAEREREAKEKAASQPAPRARDEKESR